MKNWLENLMLIGIIILLFGGGVLAGWLYFGNNVKVIEDCSTQAKIKGLWLPDIKELKNYEGQYICINIEQTKTLEDLQKIINHEIGHEIFARYCEDDFDKCLEVTNEENI